MSSQILLTHTADKSQRKLDKPLREKILMALKDITQCPDEKGEKLTQPLTGVYSYHVKYKGREFRIAYQYQEASDCVIILLIGPHENFYKRVKNLLDVIKI